MKLWVHANKNIVLPFNFISKNNILPTNIERRKSENMCI